MSEPDLMSSADVHAFGVEIVYKQLETAGWICESADVVADIATHPQIVAHKDGELGFFVVRTAVHPDRGRMESQQVYETLVHHAKAHGADCYFASVSIANSHGKTEPEMSIPVKGAAFHVAFDGLVKMDLPEEVSTEDSISK
jgi:hypothetical protein